MESIQSPFCPHATLLLGPVVTRGMSLFLYKPEALSQKRAEYFVHGLPYEVCVKSAQGTISIDTRTEEFYQEAVAYLRRLYSAYLDEDDECVIWEF